MLLFIILVVFILLAAALAWFFISHDNGEKEPVTILWLAVGFGVVGAVAAYYLEKELIPISDLTPGGSLGTIFIATLSVGLIEEGCKFIPLAVFINRQHYFNEHTDGIIYFVLAGLGFGVPENILYTLSFGTQAGVGRLVLTPFFHAATTGMVGYFLARSKVEHTSKLKVVLAFIAAVILHGIYDFGLTSGRVIFVVLSLMITLALSVGLFIFYMRAKERDQDMGLTRLVTNSFCRSCGFPNPKHNLYCEHCGHHA